MPETTETTEEQIQRLECQLAEIDQELYFWSEQKRRVERELAGAETARDLEELSLHERGSQ